MKTKTYPLAEKRAILASRCAIQREQMACYAGRFRRPAAVVDKAAAVMRVASNPLVVTAATTLLVNTRWRRFGRVSRLALKGWQLFLAFSQWRRR